ncbi:hypothetical protein [Streptacidiphilus carbonis]|uniref:hypothetical protein n=1 Tax=Streptacidiphilus carbonis TaxID=105422 RepID=UPI0005A9CB2C|nr:hypothetical protein [Streptacidiphilus carbonis]
MDTSTTAAVVNLTATQTTASGWIAAYPGNGTLPTTSNLNFDAGQTTSNLAVIPVDSSHTIKFYNRAGQTAIIADVLGTFSNANPIGSFYIPVTPTRLLDTRSGLGTTKQRLGANSTLRIKVTDTHGIPANATAVIVNLTGTGPTSATYLTAYGSGSTPSASNINLVPGQTRPVLATVPIGADGCITVYNAVGSVDVIADLEGYYSLPQ